MEVGHAAIDAGADLNLGTHAHILKGIEIYKGKVITYSLANFAFELHIPAEAFETPHRKAILEFFDGDEVLVHADEPQTA